MEDQLRESSRRPAKSEVVPCNRVKLSRMLSRQRGFLAAHGYATGLARMRYLCRTVAACIILSKWLAVQSLEPSHSFFPLPSSEVFWGACGHIPKLPKSRLVMPVLRHKHRVVKIASSSPRPLLCQRKNVTTHNQKLTRRHYPELVQSPSFNLLRLLFRSFPSRPNILLPNISVFSESSSKHSFNAAWFC